MKRANSGSRRRAALLLRRYAVAVGGLAYAFTLGLRRGRHRGFVAVVARHFGYTGHLPGSLPEVGFDDVTPCDVPVVLPRVLSRPGNVSQTELIAIARLVAAARPQTVLEIGTFDGRTTLALAANSPASAQIVTLDLPPNGRAQLPVESRDVTIMDDSIRGELFAASPLASKIRQVYGDSATYDFRDLAVDFAFIDGSHSYDYALSDSRRVRAMMRDGRGTIVWHDYGDDWEGVTAALDELSREPEFAGLARIEGTTLAFLRL